jgi:ribonuclease HI
LSAGPAASGARAWIDGASRGNPGAAGFGVLIESGGGTEEVLGYLGTTTNNIAEYAGLLAALHWALRHRPANLLVHSDSELLVKQIRGQYRVKAPHLVPLFTEAKKLIRQLPKVELRHVPRGQNSAADGLANRAVDQQAPLPEWLKLPLPVP